MSRFEDSLSPVLVRSRNAPRRVNWRRERSPVWGSTKVPFRSFYCRSATRSLVICADGLQGHENMRRRKRQEAGENSNLHSSWRAYAARGRSAWKAMAVLARCSSFWLLNCRGGKCAASQENNFSKETECS